MFGRSAHIDLYGVAAKLCDDIEFLYSLLEDLPKFLGMDLMCTPVVIRLKPDCPWPDKAGLTGFVALVQSGITVVHTITPKGFVSFDIYTCGELDINKTLAYLTDKLSPHDIEFHYLERGLKYGA